MRDTKRERKIAAERGSEGQEETADEGAERRRQACNRGKFLG